ncbi:MAG TPA: urease accessory protein UreD [Acidimicrobiales bacterium]|nr:urease accessory protein UreD [Acidimicrobiales bacterium]
MEGYNRIVVGAGPRGTRIIELRSGGPLALFPTCSAEVTLVAAAGGPVGGDRVVLDIEVGLDSELTIRSAGASVLLGGAEPSCMLVRASVAGTLRWLVEPTIATACANHDADTRIWLTDEASLCWQDEAVFGRTGEEAGSCQLGLSVDRGGRPLLRHRVEVGSPGWDGPAQLAGHRALATVLVVGEDEAILGRPPEPSDRRARLDLEDGASLLTAVGDDLTEARSHMRRLLPPEA